MLSDLIKYIPAQKERIDSISPGLDPNTMVCNYWREFRESIWGKDASKWQMVEDVDRGDDRVRDDRLPDGPPGSCTVATLPKSLPDAWSIDSKKILVRTDYHEALNAALLANDTNVTVFVVRGQPGIGELPFPPPPAQSDLCLGKSIFLLWLLMHRLAHRLPTALQIHHSYAILFHEDGVSQFLAPDDKLRYPGLRFEPEDRSKRIWALVDTNQSLLEPADIFKNSPSFFIVNSVSPRAKYTDWIGKLSYQKFYVNPWSVMEILQGYVDPSAVSQR